MQIIQSDIMKGCYCLIISLKDIQTIKIGKLGIIKFKKGCYVYVGSAMNSLEARLKRHLSDDKKLHWHIDYLLRKSEITDIIYNENKKVECELSQTYYPEQKALKTSDVQIADVKAICITLKIEMKLLNALKMHMIQ